MRYPLRANGQPDDIIHRCYQCRQTSAVCYHRRRSRCYCHRCCRRPAKRYSLLICLCTTLCVGLIQTYRQRAVGRECLTFDALITYGVGIVYRLVRCATATSCRYQCPHDRRNNYRLIYHRERYCLAVACCPLRHVVRL